MCMFEREEKRLLNMMLKTTFSHNPVPFVLLTLLSLDKS